MRMPCGTHKGEEVSSLPTDYLRWVAENWEEKTKFGKRLCKEADQELQQRIREGSAS